MSIIDENRIPAIIGASNADGVTLLPIYANSSSNSMKVDDGTGGSDKGGNPDPRDGNRKVAFLAVSSADGETPVTVYVDSVTNGLLINSN